MWGQAPEVDIEMVAFSTFLARYGVGGGTTRRMPKRALMSGFEKPPPPAPNAGKGARWRFAAPGANGGVKGGCRRKTLCVKFIYDWR